MNDWYSCIDINFLDLNEFDTLTLDTSSSKNPPITTQNMDDSLETPVKQMEEELTAPEQNKEIQVHIESPQIGYFDTSVLSTPAKQNWSNSYISSPMQRTQQNSSLLSNDTTTVRNAPYTYSLTSIHDKSSIFMPVIAFTTNSIASPNQLALTYLVSIPSDATSTTPTMTSTVISSIQTNKSNDNHLLDLTQQIDKVKTNKRPGYRAKRSRFKSARYIELENLDPNATKPKVSTKI